MNRRILAGCRRFGFVRIAIGRTKNDELAWEKWRGHSRWTMSFALLVTLAGMLFCLTIQRAEARDELFVKHCAACHGKDGKGQTPIGRKIGAKDLGASKRTRAEIEKQVLEGVKDAKGVVKMPGFSGKVSDDELRQLVEYTLKMRK